MIPTLHLRNESLAGLEVFATVVDAGRFVRAAAVLGMTQSGVSRSIARLEGRLGVRLIDRTTRAIHLTDEGRRLHEQVRPLLENLEDVLNEASDAKAQVRGRLRVAVDPYFSRLMLAPQVERFLEEHPGLSLQLLTRQNPVDLVGEGFDVSVRFGEPKPSALIARRLLETRIVTVAAPRYLARHGRPQTPEALASGHECIQFIDPETAAPFEWEFHRRKEVKTVKTRGRLTVSDVGVAHEACLAGQGIAQLKELGNEQLIRHGKLIVLFPEWVDERYPLYAFHPSRRLPPPKVRAFLDFVRGVIDARRGRRSQPSA